MGYTALDFVICLIQLTAFIAYIMVIMFLISLIFRSNCGTSTEFYIHFIVNGFIDILTNIFDILIRRFPKWNLFISFFKSYLWIGNLSPIIYYSTVANCALGILIITFNRYVQMHFPLDYKHFWTKKTTVIMILFQIIVPYLSYIYLVNYEVVLIYSNDNNYYYHSMKDKTASTYNSLIMCIWSGLIFIFGLKMNISNIRKYVQIIFNKKKESKVSTSKIFLYSMYCFVISISLLLVFLNSCYKLYAVIINDKLSKEEASNNYEWIILLMTCCHPFLILSLSKELRTKFLTFYSISQPSRVSSVPFTINVRWRKSINRTVIQ
ncbi:7TM GPCR, serpentine receptor class v (Srv) family-containing protein [Strongyloides ratti]|uniref:7TM GPCR, serpentine receptor class v (Srv) family-containing protein n=1 Tax=Strongyloides ratti TaxID=34506 RepID=A0A090LUV8_STRRB|nr:7TM GPCR, serpentine receptor class v (Srv) family-containing protein [Strongyloides ratti]CEF71424.1 7TM GPCR, serpentine receptor class v (Srv) family-containing protein [Strongyloides ratti]